MINIPTGQSASKKIKLLKIAETILLKNKIQIQENKKQIKKNLGI